MAGSYGDLGADDYFGNLRRRRAELVAAIVKRRRLAAAALVVSTSAKDGRGPQGKKQRDAAAFVWKDHLHRLSEEEFKLRYRLSFDSFYALLRKLWDDLSAHDAKCEQQARNGSMRRDADGEIEVVPNEVKLAIALRWQLT